MLHTLRSLLAAGTTGLIAFLFLLLWMHASPLAAAGFSAGLGVLVLAISGPSPERDRAADEAWQAAAPDLPPFSERVRMERDQEALPAPVPPSVPPAPMDPTASEDGLQ